MNTLAILLSSSGQDGQGREMSEDGGRNLERQRPHVHRHARKSKESTQAMLCDPKGPNDTVIATGATICTGPAWTQPPATCGFFGLMRACWSDECQGENALAGPEAALLRDTRCMSRAGCQGL